MRASIGALEGLTQDCRECPIVAVGAFVSDVRICVEVVYALPARERHLELTLTQGATVADALARVAGAPEFADLDLESISVGIYGRVVTDRNQRLNEGDRIELYRPLTVDPMTARRRRASR
jgi:putative ubiquitin-RnfH superfamily antitoxin RatB of RatAB toxin-antitoxin module